MAIQIGDLCKNGHIIDGDNVQEYLNRGRPHVRCRVCNVTPVPRKRVGDKCKNGHVIDGDNILVRKMRGTESISCKECQREASRRYRKSDKFINNPKYVKSAENAKKIQREIDAGMRGRAGVPFATMMRKAEEIDKRILKDPRNESIPLALAQVDLDKRSKDALGALMGKYLDEQSKCYDNPGPYMDYEVEPSVEQAYQLCKGCAMLVECGRFANANGPEQGVWGGEVWKSGRVKKYDR